MKNKIRKWIRSEMDVEFFSCVHSVSMVFIYGLELFICGTEQVPYAIIIQMMLLGYGISWFQKLLFLKEKLYTIWEYRVRVFLWSFGPVFLTFLLGRIAGWYIKGPEWMEGMFLVVMFLYYIMVWSFIKIFYEGESEYLNDMLDEYKKKKNIP